MFIGGTYISASVYTQLQLFGAAVLWGAAIGLVYDAVRVARHICPPPAWLYVLEDILFWITEALLIYRLLFKYDDGAIRSYTMLGILLGMALYLWLFSRWLTKGMERILDHIGRGIKILVSKIWGFSKKPVNYCAKMLKKKKKEGRMKAVNNRLK